MSWPPAPSWHPSMPPSRRTSWLLVVSSVVLGTGSLALAVLILLSGDPSAVAVGVVLAAIPVPLLLWFYLWLDSYEPEPRRYLVAGFAWGAVVATALGLVFTALGVGLTGLGGDLGGTLWAPLAEEFAKGLFLVVVVLVRRRQLHGVLDGLVYAGLVGVGFAFTENVLYYMSSYLGDGTAPGGLGAATGLFILRGVISPFAHPLFTAAIGLGVGYALVTRSAVMRVVAPIVGYAVAVALHAIWNASALLGGFGSFALTYLVVMVPAFTLMVGVGLWVRRREARVLAHALEDCADHGWLHPDEIPWTVSLTHRATARAYARRVGGPLGARALREYQRGLIELGFLHSRVLRGDPPSDAASRLGEILHHIAQWRPYVVLPPPLPRHRSAPQRAGATTGNG